ncbi:MAG: hypothetical protein B0A82_07425 [Alkalinema sp. CACIAM 70d]|nr:MAG: hypothetical protein B0A82_07425 [Alkalinema sp. CACIAM 70d]
MLGQSGYLTKAYQRGLPKWAFSQYSRQALPRCCRSVPKQRPSGLDRAHIPKARSSLAIVPLTVSSDDLSATQDAEEEEANN